MIHDNVLGKRYAVLYLHKILRKCVNEKYKCLARVVQFSLFNPDVVGRLPSVDKLLSACWASQSGSLPSMQGQLASLSSHSQNLACLSFWCIGNSGLLHGPPPGKRLFGWVVQVFSCDRDDFLLHYIIWWWLTPATFSFGASCHSNIYSGVKEYLKRIFSFLI